MAYPNTIDTWSTKTDGVDHVMASHVNLLQTQLSAVETELGVLPKGDYASVAAEFLDFLNRYRDYGITFDEHFAAGAEGIAGQAWAAYTGYATPSTVAYATHTQYCYHTGATRAFRYKAASVATHIVLRALATCLPNAAGTVHAGIMIDDGVNNADGLGANNYYRIMVECSAITTNFVIRREYRVAGGAAAAAVTAFSLPPGKFVPITLTAHMNPNWGAWWAGMYLMGYAGAQLVQFDNPPFTWTPVNVGKYYYASAASLLAQWDAYDVATS